MRLALLTTEARAATGAVARFIAANAGTIALVALSDPLARPGRTLRILRRSGPRLVPYLLANFVLPRLRRPRGTLAPLCRRLGVPVAVVPDMNAPAFLARLRASGAEAILTFHCDRILAPATLAAVPRGGLNVHPGLLPHERGPTPTIHALLRTPPRFGVTVHLLAPRIDAGPILAQAAPPLPPDVSALEAARLLHLAALDLLPTALARLEAGEEGEVVAPGPYPGFPTRAELAHLARLGRRTVR